jgi:hypothetical protein
MRTALALVLVVSVTAGCCCRPRACCPGPVRVIGTAPLATAAAKGEPKRALPEGTLEATLHYARGAAAERTNPAEAKAAWNEALALLGKEPGPARLDHFRERIRARLANESSGAVPKAEPRSEVRIFDVTDLVDVMKRMPLPQVEIVGPDGVREEEPRSLLMTVAMEQFPNQVGGGPPTITAQGSGSVVVQAVATQQEALESILLAWREVWPLLWPVATS